MSHHASDYRHDPLLDAGRRRDGVIELFLDDERLSWQQNVERRVRQPDIASGGPLMNRDHPWESRSLGNFSSVLWGEDRKHFRLWYAAVGRNERVLEKNQVSLAYAQSADGLTWEKPMMDHVAYGDVTSTNLVLGPQTNPHGTCVLVNQHSDDPSQKYLAYFDSYPAQREGSPRHAGRGTYWATSPDGIRWTPPLGTPAVSGKSDTQQSVVWVPGAQQYVAYMRGTRATNEPFGQPFGELQRVRYVRAAWSRDFTDWSRPIELMRADERDGDPDVQIHEFTVTRRGDQFIALAGMMRISQLLPSETYLTLEEAMCDVELLTSRDGLHWHRVADRQVFMPADAGPADYDHRRATSETPRARNAEMNESGHYEGGAKISIDTGRITRSTTFYMLGAHLLFDDEKVYVFHGSTNAWRKEGRGYALGLATLPRDRFQAIKPRRLAQPGVLETRPLYFDATGDLIVNADASLGQLTAELVDFNGCVIEGFEEDRCVPMKTDSYDHPLRWRSESGTVGLGQAVETVQADATLAEYPGIRIRFYLRQAWLYAVEWPLHED
ncbi:MAG: hypothetical protein CMJ18_00485 [Phycisphaeraceae bacterium]|nr:hypothetical protein [Phycisphaeraceae bacterium]